MRRVIVKNPKSLNPDFDKSVKETKDGSEPEVRTKRKLKAVPRNESNLEAEKGETVVTNLAQDGIPEFYIIGGKSHAKGGTPLNLPSDSFIFSNDKKLAISDEEILKDFKKSPGDRSYTPAELSKSFNLNKYREVLADKNSDKLQRETAEMMISNYNHKLGKLALVQESMKGFPQGIPAISLAYITANNIDPTDLVAGAGNINDNFNKNQYFQEGGIPGNDEVFTDYSKYVSQPERKRRVRVELNPQSGTIVSVPDEPVTAKKTYKKANIPKDAVIKQEGATDLQEGDYIKLADGKYKKVTGFQKKEVSYEDPKLGKLQGAYGYLESTLKDPANAELRKNVYENWKKHLRDSPKISDSRAEKLIKDSSEDQVISNFLDAQKQVYAINASGINLRENSRNWDIGKKNEVYNATIKQLGFEPFKDDEIASFQAAYRGLQDLSDDPKFQPVLSNFNLKPVGLSDQTYGKKSKAISPVDDWFGNTTAGQAMLPKIDAAPQFEDVPEETVTEDVVQFKPDEIVPEPEKRSDWWLQDIVKTAGAFGDLNRIKKRMPWAAPYQPVLADPTFYDPTRELASNAEQAAIATNAAAMFAGPQALGARTSGIQGQASANAANILAKYSNLNVQTANQFAVNNAAMLSEANKINQGIHQNLYDQTVIANQQFDNAKNMARQNLRQSYIDAIGNRANAQVMNELFPQYNISPIEGGMMNFTNGRPLTPKYPQSQDVMDIASQYMVNNPGFNPSEYFQAAKIKAGVKNPAGEFMPPEDFLQGYAQMLGQI